MLLMIVRLITQIGMAVGMAVMVMGGWPTAAAFAQAITAEGSRPGPAIQAGVVAVLRPPGADSSSQEIVTRIVAELVADGMSVIAMTCPGSMATCAPIPGMRPSAVVRVQRPGDIRTIEVRTGRSALALAGGNDVQAFSGDKVGVDGGASRAAVRGGVGNLGLIQASDGAHVRHLSDVDAGTLPAALAIRTVELLKAMLIEGAELGDDPTDAPAPSVQVPLTDAAEASSVSSSPDHRRFVLPIGARNLTVAFGAMMFAGFANLETAYGPTLGVGRRTSDHVILSLVLAGPSFGRDQRNNVGTASIRHEMAALQVDLVGLFWNVLVLRAGMGGGVYHVHVDGKGSVDVPAPNGGGGGGFGVQVTGSSGGFAGLLSWSTAAAINLRSDVGIFLEGRMFVLTPTPVILLNGLEIGRAGNPGVALSSGVELRF